MLVELIQVIGNTRQIKKVSHVLIKLDSTKSTKPDMIDTNIIKPLNEN